MTNLGTVKIISGGNRCNLTVHNGTMVTGLPPVDQTVSAWTPTLPTTTVTSAYRRIYPAEASDPTTVTIGSMTVNGTVFSNLIATFNQALLGGSSYTLTIDLNKTIYAGSNVYWDGSKMTFKPAGYVGQENFYQGLFFKWCSMIGISPAGAAPSPVTASTPIYYPTSAIGWSANSATINTLYGSAGNYASIPDKLGVTITSTSDYVTPLGFDYANYWGDICRRINAGYRLPRAEEFNLAAWYMGTDVAGVSIGYPSDVITTNQHDGTSLLDYDQYSNPNVHSASVVSMGTVFPASGVRSYAGVDGELIGVGNQCWYMTGSAYNGVEYQWAMTFSSGRGYAGNGWTYRNTGMSVRCVKN
jgi:hypothetical protein